MMLSLWNDRSFVLCTLAHPLISHDIHTDLKYKGKTEKDECHERGKDPI